MKTAIICYDLKHVKPFANIFVKAALATYINTLQSTPADNLLSPFPEWVRLTLPDTTLLAFVPDGTTAADLMEHVLQVITSAGAEAAKVYVAFIDPQSDLLYNADKKPLNK